MERIKIIFRWFDFYVGIYWDTKGRTLYIFPVPMLGLRVQFKKPPEPECTEKQRWDFVYHLITEKRDMYLTVPGPQVLKEEIDRAVDKLEKCKKLQRTYEDLVKKHNTLRGLHQSSQEDLKNYETILINNELIINQAVNMLYEAGYHKMYNSPEELLRELKGKKYVQ